MSQKLITPEISECPRCGSSNTKCISENFNEQYHVECYSCNQTLTRECGSRHRAICKWNNRVNQLTQEGVVLKIEQ